MSGTQGRGVANGILSTEAVEAEGSRMCRRCVHPICRTANFEFLKTIEA